MVIDQGLGLLRDAYADKVQMLVIEIFSLLISKSLSPTHLPRWFENEMEPFRLQNKGYSAVPNLHFLNFVEKAASRDQCTYIKNA